MIATRTDHVRRFTEDDVSQVAALHMRVTGAAGGDSPEFVESYRTNFSQVFLNHPWMDDEIGSLVYQENDGRITGFMGIIPRRMTMNGEVVQAAITSEFVVDASARGLAGVKLQSAALAGPQDLTLADEANAISRDLFEALGGSTSFLHSTRWIYPIRPFEYARDVLKQAKGDPTSLLLRVSSPIARALDWLTARILKYPPSPPPTSLIGEELTCETLLACLPDVTGRQHLRPEYDRASLSWLLARAAQVKKKGRLRQVLVRTGKGEVAGWYLYYANRGGVSELVHFCARPPFVRGVMEHLFQHASQSGTLAVAGRLEPDSAQVISDKRCLCRVGPEWLLYHSQRPDLLGAFARGDVRISRLDGEWCLHPR